LEKTPYIKNTKFEGKKNIIHENILHENSHFRYLST
jgi:hypothetical protein